VITTKTHTEIYVIGLVFNIQTLAPIPQPHARDVAFSINREAGGDNTTQHPNIPASEDKTVHSSTEC